MSEFDNVDLNEFERYQLLQEMKALQREIVMLEQENNDFEEFLQDPKLPAMVKSELPSDIANNRRNIYYKGEELKKLEQLYNDKFGMNR